MSSDPSHSDSESSRPPARGPKPAVGGGGGGRSSRSGGGGRGGGKRYFFRRRKVCKFCADKIDHIDYKDIKLLSQFVPERGKLLPRRMFGTCAEHQRKLTVAIKRARHIALLPFMGD
jgi:small subunit ribosomal protein S18